jgi:hypothetical protein
VGIGFSTLYTLKCLDWFYHWIGFIIGFWQIKVSIMEIPLKMAIPLILTLICLVMMFRSPADHRGAYRGDYDFSPLFTAAGILIVRLFGIIAILVIWLIYFIFFR